METITLSMKEQKRVRGLSDGHARSG